ncbi:tape measure protein [Limosilactobacillus coleohominis]|uniref:tape measure protein n=1 Tax=Limosilactobacillus coleohominis TaxID=181675 RepID=UPI0026EC0DC7|nr:tape measure protein [Limosilactobacillus coleohominis]
MSDGGIIVEKKIVVKAIDEVTSPLAKMNQKMTDLESKLNSLGLKFNSGATEQTTFKSALNSTKASLSEASEASKKLENSIKNIKSKDVKVKADTNEGNEKVSQFRRNVNALKREKPTVKPTVNTTSANQKLNGLKRNVESTGHSFTRLRTIIAGTAIGTSISNGFSMAMGGIKNGIVGAMRAGIQFNMTMQQMNATWDTLTGSSKKAKSMSDSIVDLSNKLGWGVDVTNELAQQFYHVFDNQPETMKLTKSFLTMGDAIGLSSDRLKQVGMDFTHMLSSSKLQLGDLNQITDAFPMFGEALLKYERKVQHNSHLTMSELRKDISAGKISAKDAETVFNQLGDRYQKASENLMGTLPGMFRQISAKWKQLMGEAMAPTTNAVNPVVKQVSEWIKDKNTTKEFEKLGKAVNNGVGSVMKALADAFGNGSVSKMLDNTVKGLTNFVQAVSKWTANNAESIVKTIKGLASIGSSVGKGVFDAIGDMLKVISGTSGNGLKGIADALTEISKHKTALNIVGRSLATYFVVSKLSKVASSLHDMYSSLKDIAGLSATKITAVMSAVGGTYDGNSKILNAVNDFGTKPTAKTVSGTLAKEATEDGAKAGGNFAKSFLLKSKALGRLVAGLVLPTKFLDLGSKAGSKTLTGFSKIFKPGFTKLMGGLKKTSSIISTSSFAQKGKLVGAKFASAFVRAGRPIKNFATRYIIPESWVKAGSRAGALFSQGMSKLNGTKLGALGKGMAGKLGAGISIGLSAIDLARGLTPSFKGDRWKMLGKGAGGLIGGGIGAYFGGPEGAMLGSMIGNFLGGWLGKAAHKGFNFIRDIFHGRITFKGILDGFSKAMSKVGKWAKDTWKSIKDWWNEDPTSSSSKSSSSHSSKAKKPSSKEIKSLGGNHYSKTDIANIREMNRAVLSYTRTLKTLKQTVKHNDPTKALNKMNKGLKSFVKDMAKSAKPLEKLAKMFKTFGKSTKTMASSIKSLTGKHGLGEFTKDLGKLNKDMKHTKVGTYFEKLAKSIKKSKLADEVKKLDTWFGGMVKDFKQLTKPLKQATKEFTSFEKTIGKLANRKTGLSKVDSDIKTLSKDLKKYNFGKVLGQQMAEADKAVGKHGFIKQFTSMMKVVEEALKSFSKDFKRYWGDTWKNLSSQAKKGLNKANRTINSKLDDIEDTGHSFERGFKRSWDNWLDDLVSAFKSGFNKLPGIAGSAMKDIVSRLNKGISGINKVIGDFGGDKKLSSISYASGTSMHSAGSAYSAHPGGMAVINDGDGPHKQELVWQPSQGWQLFAGINRHVWLEPGSQVIPGEKSHEILSRKRIPHYANGTLSDDEMDKIADAFDKNPVSASKELILKLTNWNSSKSIIPTFGKASAIAFSRGIANVLKDLLAIVQEPKNGDWGPVIRSAARKMKAHINDGFVSNLKQVIQNESGGREDRMQEIHDQNSGGNEARGLLQYTVPTFNSYAMPKFHNIMKGFHQLIAFFNNSDYANSIGWTTIWGHRKMEWLHSGPQGSRRFAFGGRVRGLQNITVGDNPEQDEFIINPYNNNALPLMKQAWQTMEAHHPELRSNENDGQFNGQVVKAVNNIDMQPQLVVDEFTNAINKRNAHNWRNAYN